MRPVGLCKHSYVDESFDYKFGTLLNVQNAPGFVWCTILCRQAVNDRILVRNFT